MSTCLFWEKNAQHYRGNDIAVYVLVNWQSSGLFRCYLPWANSSHAAPTLDFPPSNFGGNKEDQLVLVRSVKLPHGSPWVWMKFPLRPGIMPTTITSATVGDLVWGQSHTDTHYILLTVFRLTYCNGDLTVPPPISTADCSDICYRANRMN